MAKKYVQRKNILGQNEFYGYETRHSVASCFVYLIFSVLFVFLALYSMLGELLGYKTSGIVILLLLIVAVAGWFYLKWKSGKQNESNGTSANHITSNEPSESSVLLRPEDQIDEIPLPKTEEVEPLSQMIDNRISKEDYETVDIKALKRNRIPHGARISIEGEVDRVLEESDITLIRLEINGEWKDSVIVQMPTGLFVKNIMLEGDFVKVCGICLGRTDYDHDLNFSTPLPLIQAESYSILSDN